MLSSSSQTTYWDADPNTDYISFADDDDTADGFHVTIKFSDFIYSGSSQTQGDITVSNYKLIANYDNQTPQSPDIGEDDPSSTLSILPESCNTTGPEDFNFHADFSDNNKDYALTASNSEQTILTGTNNCLALGHIRIDRNELTMPQGSEGGNYVSLGTITIYDGN